ncbi:MAG TPA: DUF2339 domain-containing protein [Lacunisphaera sp.]|nr:DUF2339 domain-containing protein [Lacunisphaera sp.]
MPPELPPPPDPPADPTTLDRRRLEARLRRLERHLGFAPLSDAQVESLLAPAAPRAAAPPVARGNVEAGLEMAIGEFWLARIGVLALMVGLGLLVAYPFVGLPAGGPSLSGFLAAGLGFWVARRWRAALPEMARLLFLGSLVLCYLATLRLHFFAPEPVIASRLVVVALLIAVLTIELIVAGRTRSEPAAMLVAALGFTTAVVSETLPAGLVVMTGLATGAVWLVHRHRWHGNYALVVVLTYLTHLLLLLNDPLAGHPLKAVAAPQGNLWFLALNTGILAGAGFLPGATEQAGWLRAVRALAISGGVLVVAALNVVIFGAGRPPWIELGAATGLLALAVASWQHHASRYATSIQACAAFVALSVFLVRFFGAPACYAWLAWQSLLVAIVAVAFRSKIIVVANVMIFAGIYAVYLGFEPASGPVNLSFALVALLTARLLNWQNRRLELRTELMRNFYLAAAVVAVPYGLYHTVPSAWVSTSWLLVAACYFGVSLWLRNRKYRWMAIGTVLGTVVYVFVNDLAHLAPAYRIVSFLVLGCALLVISVFYARSRQRARGEIKPGILP